MGVGQLQEHAVGILSRADRIPLKGS